MATIWFDWGKYDVKIEKVCMDRLENAAKAIRDDAKSNLSGKLKGDWPEHGPYKSGAYAGKAWTARYHGAMANTIRYVRRDDKKNIWIMAGNNETWWAVQLEYGRGGWKGGRRSFMRPAIDNTGKIEAALGTGATL